MNDLIRNNNQSDIATILFATIDKIVTAKGKYLSEKTKSAYFHDLESYISYCMKNNIPILDKDFTSLRRYIESLDKKPVTINRKLISIRRAISQYAKDTLSQSEASIVQTMLQSIKTTEIDGEIKESKIISEEEFQKLMDSDSIPDRIKLMMLFLYKTGCRISEMAGVRLSNIKSNRKNYHIGIIGKGNKYREVLLRKDTIDEIKKIFNSKVFLFETIHGKQYKIEYISREIKRHGEKILNRNFYPHMLRHSFATSTIRRTGKIKAVSKYLGHSSSAITLDMYTHESLTEEDLFGE